MGGQHSSRKTSILAVLLAGICLVLISTVVRVHGATTPPRRAQPPAEPETLRVAVRPVGFSSVDGLQLEGWMVPGRPGKSPIVLCHDLGASKSAMLGLALDLSEAGFPLLLFDFRAHGTSGGRRSTLGLEEKRDVLGAVDYLRQRPEFSDGSIGLYGVGMGAHAAVLAAKERRSVRVLVLDGLYPDASYPLVRRVFADWGTGVRHLGFLPRMVFTVLNRTRLGEERAAEVLSALTGRDLLLLAPASDAVLADEIHSMYQTIPVRRDSEGNLVLLPSTQSEGLYGDDLTRHHAHVVEFFLTRLTSRRSGETVATIVEPGG